MKPRPMSKRKQAEIIDRMYYDLNPYAAKLEKQLVGKAVAGIRLITRDECENAELIVTFSDGTELVVADPNYADEGGVTVDSVEFLPVVK